VGFSSQSDERGYEMEEIQLSARLAAQVRLELHTSTHPDLGVADKVMDDIWRVSHENFYAVCYSALHVDISIVLYSATFRLSSILSQICDNQTGRIGSASRGSRMSKNIPSAHRVVSSWPYSRHNQLRAQCSRMAMS